VESNRKRLFHNKTMLVIVFNLAFIIFGLGGLATGTMAWFASQTSFATDIGSFSIAAPEGMKYSLFYLHHFIPDPLEPETTKDGNYDNVISEFAGYETNYEHASFTEIDIDDGVVVDDPNPTSIKDLWPNHKLTFAILITSSLNMNKLTLKSWGEKTLNTSKISSGSEDEDYVHLSWAINIYGKAYSVAKTANDSADVATGYESYWDETKDNRFDYSQASPATPETRTEITTVGSEGYETTVEENTDIIGYQKIEAESVVYDNTVPENAGTNRTIAYFTIEFSDDESTFYEMDSSGYWDKATSGTSNCYEKLSLTSLEFVIQ